jgi:hypothetical protein
MAPATVAARVLPLRQILDLGLDHRRLLRRRQHVRITTTRPAHWHDATAAGWLHTLIEWEEQERARRSLERRLKDTMAIYDKACSGAPVERPTIVKSFGAAHGQKGKAP